MKHPTCAWWELECVGPRGEVPTESTRGGGNRVGNPLDFLQAWQGQRAHAGLPSVQVKVGKDSLKNNRGGSPAYWPSG